MINKKIPPTDLENIIPLLMGVWRRFHKLAGPSDKLQTREFRSVVEAVMLLQAGLEQGKELAGMDYFSKPELLGAYLLYHWIIHYQEGLCLINELPFTPKRVLDLCSGPAPLSFAALRHGAQEVIAIDKSQIALEKGAEICGRYGYPLSIRKQDCLKNLNVEGKFDLILVGHCLEELFPDTQKNWPNAQEKWIQQLLTRLTPEGQLILIESSALVTNRRVLQLRDQLVQAGLAVQAPCVWQGECPALKTKNSPCYAQRELDKPYLIKQIQRAAQINLSSLKMSYLIVRAPGAKWPELPKHPLYRVVSPPIESHMGKRYYLCGTDGKKNLGSHITQHPPESRAFEYLKRGELIYVKDALQKENSLDIVQETEVKIVAALNKPLPFFEDIN